MILKNFNNVIIKINLIYKYENKDKTNNLTIEELTKTLKNKNVKIIVLYIISTKEMILYLKEYNQFGLDLTFKIISNSYKPYKLMSLYGIDKKNNHIILVAFILLKFKDFNSLKKFLHY